MGGMLMPLPPDQHSAVEALFDSMRHHLALRALLAGVVPGRVYVDRPERPVAALAWSQQRLYAAGTPALGGLRATLERSVGPEARDKGVRYLGVYAAPTAEQPVAEAMAGRIRRAATRVYLELAGPPPVDWREVLPAGYEVRLVNQALLDAGLEQTDRLREEMCSERPSVAAFLAQSFGVCAVHRGTVAGWCLSEYNHDRACEVGIEVLPPHRGRRLGTALTLALVSRAGDEGIHRIGWHCYVDNAASVRTAQAAGFQAVQQYPAWVVEVG
jgi:RimJ/RimL family protein N-acetyltransferase